MDSKLISLNHIIFWGKWQYAHFTEKKTKAQISQITWPKSHSTPRYKLKYMWHQTHDSHVRTHKTTTKGNEDVSDGREYFQFSEIILKLQD